MLTKDGGRYDGFDWAIANAIAKRIGVDNVVIVAGKYSELPGRLISGKADVIIRPRSILVNPGNGPRRP